MMQYKKHSLAKSLVAEAIRAWRIFVPLVVLFCLLILLLTVSALIFRSMDDSLANVPLSDVILFEFGTLTTIGYGNIYPKSDLARIYTIVFSIFGIPIMLLTLANFGRHVSKAFWLLMTWLRVPNASSKVGSDAPMPMAVVLLFFLVTFIAGSRVVNNSGEGNSIDKLYFSFISFTTVGFGDRIPLVETNGQMLLTILYLTWGILLTTELFSILNKYFRKVHFLGRRFTGARDVNVWVGGKKLTVSELIEIVANQFQASPREVREMLRDLDDILPRVAAERDNRVPLVTHLEDFDVYD